MKDTVCVTGGSGGIGQALLEKLIDLYQVRALFRKKTEISDKWEQRGCTAVWGDLEDHSALSELVKGAKFTFHCAALVTRASYKQSYAANVEGTQRLARIAATNGCQRFIHISSAAVYSGTTTPADYTEDTDLRRHDDMAIYSSTKLQSEHALQEVAKQNGLEYTILRPTCVYGPNTKSYTLVPISLIRKGLPVILGDGLGILDAVYVDDVARALLLAANSPHAADQVFNIGHEISTLNDFYSHYGAMLKRQVRHLPLSHVSTMVRMLGSLPGNLKAKSKDLRNSAGFLIEMSLNSKRFPSSKAAAVLGYSPEFSLFQGMLRTELWAKQQHLIPKTQYFVEAYGALPFRPSVAIHPANEEELVQAVRIARDLNVTVRAIGSLHSLSPIPETEGICMILDRYNKLTKIEESFVTVQAGMKLKDLNSALVSRNLALPITGTITAQTVSGAVSTATHGGSIHYGSLSDYVESVRIIKADGTITEIDRSHHAFQALMVSMGLLGIISTVTFRCIPSFFLKSSGSVRKAEDVLENFYEIHQSGLYIDMLYFAATDEIEILTINKVEQSEGNNFGPEEPQAVKKPPSPLNAKVRYGITILSLKSLAWLLRKGNPIQRYFTRFSVGSSYRPRVGRSDLVLAFSDLGTSGRSPGIIRDMEVAVPYGQACAVIRVLRDHFLTTRKYPLLPIHIRCSPRSELWLSPAYKQDVCWLEFWQYPRNDTLLEKVHELLKPFRYRFHWGKESLADREYIMQQYEKWDDFVQLRSAWDPKGMFLNRYLETFFL